MYTPWFNLSTCFYLGALWKFQQRCGYEFSLGSIFQIHDAETHLSSSLARNVYSNSLYWKYSFWGSYLCLPRCVGTTHFAPVGNSRTQTLNFLHLQMSREFEHNFKAGLSFWFPIFIVGSREYLLSYKLIMWSKSCHNLWKLVLSIPLNHWELEFFALHFCVCMCTHNAFHYIFPHYICNIYYLLIL